MIVSFNESYNHAEIFGKNQIGESVIDGFLLVGTVFDKKVSTYRTSRQTRDYGDEKGDGCRVGQRNGC